MKHKKTKQQIWFIRKVLFSIFCYIVFLVATVDITKGMSLGEQSLPEEKAVLEQKLEDDKKTTEETEKIEETSTVKDDDVQEKTSEIINDKYKYAKGNIRVFKEAKITPKAEDNLKIGTRLEVIEEKKVEIVKEKTVKKPDGKTEVQKTTTVENWEKNIISKIERRELAG